MNQNPYNPPPPYGGGYGGPPPGGYGYGGYPPPPGGFGAPPPFGAPMMPQPYEEVNTTLPIVLNAICLSLCCMPIGVIGIIIAVQASNAKGLGDFETARNKARGATILAVVTMGACAVLYTLFFLLSLIGG
jgi:hypothetical protein